MINPIGLFDSGIGGTSIWREIVKELPHENTLLLADSLNAPYGNKTRDEIIFLCEKNTEFLLKNNCKLIVVACNTATTNAIGHLRQKYSVPFIGIEPAVKPASINSKTKVIGVLATQGTISSDLFHQTSQKFAKEQGIEIVEQIGHGLVELIENGQINEAKTEQLLEAYLLPMKEKNIDHLVLGCTHYPYLIPLIQRILPSSITLIDSGSAVAKQTRNILEKHQILNPTSHQAEHHWVTNKNLENLKKFCPKNGVKIELIPH